MPKGERCQVSACSLEDDDDDDDEEEEEDEVGRGGGSGVGGSASSSSRPLPGRVGVDGERKGEGTPPPPPLVERPAAARGENVGDKSSDDGEGEGSRGDGLDAQVVVLDSLPFLLFRPFRRCALPCCSCCCLGAPLLLLWCR